MLEDDNTGVRWGELLCGYSGKQQVGYPPSKQHPVNVGAPEASFPWLIDDSLAGPGRQLFDDVVAVFTPDKKPTHGALVANANAVMSIGG